jgi:hypothetical protein
VKYWKTYAGILLLLLAVAGLFFWETAGRDKVLMEEVIVAGRDIQAGAVLQADMLQTARIPKGSSVKGGFPAGAEEVVAGQRTSWPIAEKQQISSGFFTAAEEELQAGEAYFVIPERWIAMRTSALRRGDAVEILPCSGGAMSLGTYKLAFVKDSDEGEVRDLSPAGELLYEPRERQERTDAGSVIDHVEIIATAEAYFMIRAFAENLETPSLVLVQRGRMQ